MSKKNRPLNFSEPAVAEPTPSPAPMEDAFMLDVPAIPGTKPTARAESADITSAAEDFASAPIRRPSAHRAER